MNLKETLWRLRELRRALPIAAAALLVLALFYPMWRITLEAPQYPEYPDGLIVEVFAYPHLEGDWKEVQALNQYIGFYFPDPVFVDPNYDVHENAIRTPEWVLGPIAFLAVAGAGVFVAFAPTVRKLKIGLTCMLVGTLTTFIGMFAFIQYRLHQAGHSLDPDAPLRGVSEFTPPVFGVYEVANITGIALPWTGAYITMVAIGLIVLAFFLRDTDATPTDIPALILGLPGAIRARIAWARRTIGSVASAVTARFTASYEDASSTNDTDSESPD